LSNQSLHDFSGVLYYLNGTVLFNSSDLEDKISRLDRTIPYEEFMGCFAVRYRPEWEVVSGTIQHIPTPLTSLSFLIATENSNSTNNSAEVNWPQFGCSTSIVVMVRVTLD
jgi:hypothetical protein